MLTVAGPENSRPTDVEIREPLQEIDQSSNWKLIYAPQQVELTIDVAPTVEWRHDPVMKGVFKISGASRYDDLIAERYHFPRTYLRAVEACVSDWIIYRETGSAGGGPDVVQNGIALSATAHWLFDRHLISLDDESRLLVSHNKVPSELIRLFPRPGERVHLPADPRLHPRPDYIARHRARFAGLNA